jgi:beta-1,4-mannosyl-glycoprotein beta-1,4-N-acetylglucosaminyltransferase
LRHFNFYLNWETPERWLRSGPRAVRRRFLDAPHQLRAVRGPKDGFADAIRAIRTARLMGRPMRRHLVRDGGWHFTYLGGAAAVGEKLESFIGSEKPVMPDSSADAIARRIARGVPVNPRATYDLMLREIDATFPRHIRENRERYAALIAGQAPPRRKR